MAKRTIEEQIADLKAKQELQLKRATAKAQWLDIGGAMHVRDYAGAVTRAEVLVATLRGLIAPAAEPEGKGKP